MNRNKKPSNKGKIFYFIITRAGQKNFTGPTIQNSQLAEYVIHVYNRGL
jgi:hypothetical protein